MFGQVDVSISFLRTNCNPTHSLIPPIASPTQSKPSVESFHIMWFTLTLPVRINMHFILASILGGHHFLSVKSLYIWWKLLVKISLSAGPPHALYYWGAIFFKIGHLQRRLRQLHLENVRVLTCKMTYNKMLLVEKHSQAGQKKQSMGIKSFYWNTPYGFEYKKNCISKLSIKVFIKRKTKARKGLCLPNTSEFW